MLMTKRDLPFAKANSIYDIPPEFFRGQGIEVVLSDLDNTLLPYGEKEPSAEALAYKKRLEDAGILLVICSNGLGERVRDFAERLGVEAAGFMRKPCKGPLKRLIEERGWKPESVVLIGDQIQTDVRAANGAGIRAILTDPFPCKEPIWTRFNRIFERPKRRKIAEKSLVPNWEEVSIHE